MPTFSSIDAGVMDPWISGPGKKPTHHSGLVVYAHRSLKVMAPCDEKPQEPNRKKAQNRKDWSARLGVREDEPLCVPNSALLHELGENHS